MLVRGMRCTAWLWCAVLAGCVSSKGIAPHTPTMELRPAEVDSSFQAWPATDWWRRYQEPPLDGLISHALSDHPSVQLAEARLAQANAGKAFMQSRDGLQVVGGYHGVWQRFTENGQYPEGIAGTHDVDSTLGLDATLDLDLFGRNRALVAAMAAQAEAGTAGIAAAQLAIATTISQTYFELAHRLALREIARATRVQREKIKALVEVRVAQGLDSNVELRQAEAAIHQTDGALAELDEGVSLARLRLARLAVVPFADVKDLAPNLKDVPAPPLPVAIPSDLLARRPDVAAARWRVESATQGMASVRAEFYPTVNLGAFVGLSSIGLSDLFDSGARIYGLRPAISLPIFDAGRLRAKLGFVSATVDAFVAEYNDSVQNALRDVVRALVALQGLDARWAAQRAAQSAAESAYELALQRYQAGLTNYLTVLATETDVLAQRRAAADLKARALQMQVALSFALGGGFDDTPALAHQ